MIRLQKSYSKGHKCSNRTWSKMYRPPIFLRYNVELLFVPRDSSNKIYMLADTLAMPYPKCSRCCSLCRKSRFKIHTFTLNTTKLNQFPSPQLKDSKSQNQHQNLLEKIKSTSLYRKLRSSEPRSGRQSSSKKY